MQPGATRQAQQSRFDRRVSNWEWKLFSNGVTVSRNFNQWERKIEDGVESGEVKRFFL